MPSNKSKSAEQATVQFENVLWADDDAQTTLEPIARLLRRRGRVALVIAEDYHQAIDILNKNVGSAPNDRIGTLLVDTILPPGVRNSALGNYLGIELAKNAGTLIGIRQIAFLSVVLYGEVADHIANLELQYPEIQFHYFNKLDLFLGNHFEDLLTAVSGQSGRKQ